MLLHKSAARLEQTWQLCMVLSVALWTVSLFWPSDTTSFRIAVAGWIVYVAAFLVYWFAARRRNRY